MWRYVHSAARLISSHASEAYRQAYDTNASAKTINEKGKSAANGGQGKGKV